jgi:hypothetical protein
MIRTLWISLAAAGLDVLQLGVVKREMKPALERNS